MGTNVDNIYELFQKMLPYGGNFRRPDGEYTYDGVHLILPPCGGGGGGGVFVKAAFFKN